MQKTNFQDCEAGSYFKVYKSWPSVASPTDIQNKPLVKNLNSFYFRLRLEKDVDKVTGSSISATLILSLHAQFTVRLARN